MSARVAAIVWVACCVLGAAVPALAQTPSDRGRLELSGGIGWIGTFDFGTVPANEVTEFGGTRPLFKSATELDRSVGATGTIGVRLSRQFRVEAAVAYNPASLSSRVTSDVEGIPDVTITSSVKQFLIDGGVAVEPARWRTGHLAPFLSAGIGYLRQLNEGRTLVQTGRAYYVGGGVSYVRETTRQRRLKATGIRVDARAMIMRDGVAPTGSSYTGPAIGVSLFTRF